MPSAVSELSDVELSEVEAVVGTQTFQLGRSYASNNRVATIEWDPDIKTLTGAVIGRGAVYNTAAFFASDGGGSLGLDDGECTCPVGYNCKHVAAIVIAASDWTRRRSAARKATPAAAGRDDDAATLVGAAAARADRPAGDAGRLATRWRSSWRCTRAASQTAARHI